MSMTTPEHVGVEAAEVSAPPDWALLQRHLIDAINTAAPMMLDKYTERGGAPYYANDVDDLYELFYNWGLIYAIGGNEKLRDGALRQWNAVTRFCDDGIVSRVHPRFGQQIHNEYYSSTEWHHQSEGNTLFYDLGLADPTISENVRRARRFAAMFIGEDPEAPNYDARHNILRSPVPTSRGPGCTRMPNSRDACFLEGKMKTRDITASVRPSTLLSKTWKWTGRSSPVAGSKSSDCSTRSS